VKNDETTVNEPAAPSRRILGAAIDRRSVLKGIAIAGAGAAVPLLAACGGSSGNTSAENNPERTPGSSTPSSTPQSSPSDGGNGSSADVLTPTADVPVGGGVILPAKQTVVTQPTKGTFEGFSSTCTHMGCTVANIQDGRIICPCHGSMYSIKDGSVLGGPAPRPLPKKPVKVEGPDVVSA
jgi:Rieske Fe-S protein